MSITTLIRPALGLAALSLLAASAIIATPSSASAASARSRAADSYPDTYKEDFGYYGRSYGPYSYDNGAGYDGSRFPYGRP